MKHLVSAFFLAALTFNPFVLGDEPLAKSAKSDLHSQFAPYYTVDHGYMTMLMLNNASRFPIVVRPILYSLTGQAVVLPLVRLTPNETQEVDLNMAAASLGEDFATGSVRLDFNGSVTTLGAMVMMMNESKSLELDVLARIREGFRSSRLEGVWWIPHKGAEIRLAIQNTTNHEVEASLSLGSIKTEDEDSRHMKFKPHETRLIHLKDSLADGSARVGGITLRHDGQPGALVGEVLMVEEKAGFSAGLNLEDPSTFDESKIEGAGVLLGVQDPLRPDLKLTGHLLVRNISDVGVTAIPILERGFTKTFLGDVTLEPGEVREVTVPPDILPASVTGTGVEVKSTGAPGSLLGYWLSEDASGSLVVETPLRNVSRTTRLGGNNPWSLEDGVTSILYVKNTGGEPASFISKISYAGGEYVIGLKEMVAQETVAIDIGKLRDGRVPDVNGKTLPGNVVKGQILWLWREGPPLVGRVNTMNVAKGIASNMSCQACCQCPSTADMQIVPDSFSAHAGQSVGLELLENYTDNCNGTIAYSVPASNALWGSSSTSVATVNGSGIVSCRAPGSTTIDAAATLSTLDIDTSIDPPEGGSPCYCTTSSVFVDATSNATVIPTITGTGRDLWSFNGAQPSAGATVFPTSITLTADGSGTITWNVTSGANQVILTPNGNTATVRSNGTAFSHTGGDVGVSVTANGATSVPFNITTHRPYRLVFDSLQQNCDAGFGYSDFLSYKLFDQLGTDMSIYLFDFNEAFTTAATNDNGSNWAQFGLPVETPATNSEVVDHITGVGVNNQPPPSPMPVCNGNPIQVEHFTQEWRIGGLARGSGVRVSSEQFTRYADHAAYVNFTSPSDPNF